MGSSNFCRASVTVSVTVFVSVMAPPRKRQKVTGLNVKSNVLSSMADVCEVRICLKDWISDLYAVRHGLGSEPEHAWPVLHGGSFQEIVERCWEDMDTLMEDSLTLLKAVGMMDDAADVSHMEEKWLKLKEWVCNKWHWCQV